MTDMTAESQFAAKHLREGGLIAFPTETVYGLGADAANPLAVRRIFATKRRPTQHPLIVHVRNLEEAEHWAQFDRVAQKLAKAFWPGPLTLILPRRKHVHDEVTGGLHTIGIRVPDHPMAQEILRCFKGGIAAPSANRFGGISPTTAAHVAAEFPDGVFLVEGGECRVGIESTILDLSGPPALLRPGWIAAQELEPYTGPLGSSNTPAPGSHDSHYAPHTCLLLSEHPAEAAEHWRNQGRSVAVLHAMKPAIYAMMLYKELHRLDKLGVDLLIAEPAKGSGVGIAIN
ncbi:MAG TPA: threonylcarbamoyl-AMP synthase, partial [Myxococcales bacterium]|nr:threonylcarbamoyl-AMP synthase [Myxococcales bacterium]